MTTGVFLLQMGGPRTVHEVEEYIRVLFSDKDLVRLPWFIDLFRGPLARKVARRRAPEVRSTTATRPRSMRAASARASPMRST